MGKHHKEFNKTLPMGIAGKDCLSLVFPAFLCETKLDGERIIAHIKRGIVTLHSRRDNWYSSMYSPVLGPNLRRSLKYDIDCILDGEVIAWDNKKLEVIPFGQNKTVAKARREYLKEAGKLDERDCNLHQGIDDERVLGADAFNLYIKDMDTEALNTVGSNCWLKFVIFDVLYIGGPDAGEALDCIRPFKATSCLQGGSIIQLDLFRRRTILHHIISVMENEIEIVESLIIRSDGSAMSGEKYFLSDSSVYSIEDSVECALEETLQDFSARDKERRKNRSDKDIEASRALHVDKFYAQIVQSKKEEGLIFKDLNSSYVLGANSRSTGYWRKLKPEYEKLSSASDLDFGSYSFRL